MPFDAQVIRHHADDKAGKYTITMEGMITGLTADIVKVIVSMTSEEESILEKLPRGKVMTFKMEANNQKQLG